MDKSGFLGRILAWLRSLIRSFLRALFPSEMHGQLGLLDETAQESGGDNRPAGASSPSARGEDEPDEEEIRRMKQTPVERRHIVFYGRVQGVGFRYYAMNGARRFGLTGWVENLMDGTVEMEIQGPAAQIDYVLEALHKGSWIRIDAMDMQRIPAVEGERGFRVRGY